MDKITQMPERIWAEIEHDIDGVETHCWYYGEAAARMHSDGVYTEYTRTDIAHTQLEAMAEALRLVLPMAKGYAAAHPVGSNALYIETAEQQLAQYQQFKEMNK